MPTQVLPVVAPGARVPTRTHWVKVRFRDSNMPVGIVHEDPRAPGRWVFDHRTDDTVIPPGIVSPMGLDVVVLDYLLRQDPPILDVHFWPEDSSVILTVPLVEFAARRMEARLAETFPRGTIIRQRGVRNRIFVPTELWSLIPFYAENRPPYWDVTQLTEDGTIEAQHVAVPR